MGRAKEIIVKVIPASVANPFVKKHHYSGKVVPNAKLHFGCFLDGRLHGVMSFGPSMDKRKMLCLVETENKDPNVKFNEFLELNRMAFDDYLPTNSESRCLGVAFRLIKKNAPHIKYIISFSDGTASGDGTIYRASGFKLTSIKRNNSILVMPDGERIAKVTITAGVRSKKWICERYGIPMWGGQEQHLLLQSVQKAQKVFSFVTSNCLRRTVSCLCLRYLFRLLTRREQVCFGVRG